LAIGQLMLGCVHIGTANQFFPNRRADREISSKIIVSRWSLELQFEIWATRMTSGFCRRAVIAPLLQNKSVESC